MKTKLDFIKRIKDSFKIRFAEVFIKEEDKNKIIELTKEWCDIPFLEEIPYIDEYIQNKVALEGHVIIIIVNNYFHDMFYKEGAK